MLNSSISRGWAGDATLSNRLQLEEHGQLCQWRAIQKLSPPFARIELWNRWELVTMPKDSDDISLATWFKSCIQESNDLLSVQLVNKSLHREVDMNILVLIRYSSLPARGKTKILTWGVHLRIWTYSVYILFSIFNRWSNLIIYWEIWIRCRLYMY